MEPEIDATETPEQQSRLPTPVRKVAVGAVGGVVTAGGLVMLVTPGPGALVTLAGLAILGREFPAARRVVDRVRGWGSRNGG
jgi:hypothetical protein